MDWIYLSPHLDDVALSCGGLVWEQTRRGEAVSIWTICAGNPPPLPLSPLAADLHARWQTGSDAVAQRRLEDIAACRGLNATWRHLSIPDCIYRRASFDGEALYGTEEAIFGALHPADAILVDELSDQFTSSLPRSAALACPLAVGGHVDHQLTRAAVEKLFQRKAIGSKWSLWYYADYPYVRDAESRASLPTGESWVVQKFAVTAEGLSAWGKAVSAYNSQISTFWPNLESMQTALLEYSQQEGGVRLWARYTI
jgi:LmbE family N-acetylglucosaminyl deacetylase